MDFIQVLLGVASLLLTGLCIVLWANHNDLKEQAKQTQKELADYKVQVAKEYASREEMDRFLATVTRTMEQHTIIISNRIDRLEDLIEKVRDRE